MSIFDRTVSLAERSLDMRSQRNQILASNIANRETPGYLAKDVVFEKELAEAYQADRPGPLKTTDPRHFDGVRRQSVEDVAGGVIHSFNPDPKKDGNTVNLDKEMSKLAENQVMFDASVKIARYKLNHLKTIVREGG